MTHDFAEPMSSQKEPKGSKKRKEKSGPSAFGIAVMLSMIVGFVAFIVHLDGKGSTEQVTAQATEAEPAATDTMTEEATPPAKAPTTQEEIAKPESAAQTTELIAKTEPRFKFYDELKNQRVEVDEIEAYMTREERLRHNNANYVPPKYFVQAASFKSEHDADKLRAKLLLNGLNEAQVRGGSKTIYYRVVAGPYTSRKQINHARKIMYRFSLQPLLLRDTTLTRVTQ